MYFCTPKLMFPKFHANYTQNTKEFYACISYVITFKTLLQVKVKFNLFFFQVSVTYLINEGFSKCKLWKKILWLTTMTAQLYMTSYFSGCWCFTIGRCCLQFLPIIIPLIVMLFFIELSSPYSWFNTIKIFCFY